MESCQEASTLIVEGMLIIDSSKLDAGTPLTHDNVTTIIHNIEDCTNGILASGSPRDVDAESRRVEIVAQARVVTDVVVQTRTRARVCNKQTTYGRDL